MDILSKLDRRAEQAETFFIENEVTKVGFEANVL